MAVGFILYRTYKYRIYPDDIQEKQINKIYGCQRFVYNYYLSKIKDNGYISSRDNIKDFNINLKKNYPFLSEVDGLFIRKTLFILDDDIKKSNDHPKYRGKNSKDKFILSNSYSNIIFDLEKNRLELPFLGEIKFRGYKNIVKIDDNIINVTITRENTGKYYANFLYKIPDKKRVNATSIVGIDIGIKNLITLSHGTIYENNRYLEKYEKKISQMQKVLSKKIKGSNNYKKYKKKINIIYNKIARSRKFYIDKIVREIVEKYDIIVCEKLTTKNMISNGNLSKQILDASFTEILKRIESKAEEKGKYFYQIDTYYPSSQICSVCGNRQRKYKDLKEREYLCPKCGNNLDRDYNASVNIMFEGLKLHMKRINSR